MWLYIVVYTVYIYWKQNEIDSVFRNSLLIFCLLINFFTIRRCLFYLQVVNWVSDYIWFGTKSGHYASLSMYSWAYHFRLLDFMIHIWYIMLNKSINQYNCHRNKIQVMYVDVTFEVYRNLFYCWNISIYISFSTSFCFYFIFNQRTKQK